MPALNESGKDINIFLFLEMGKNNILGSAIQLWNCFISKVRGKRGWFCCQLAESHIFYDRLVSILN